jgi:hypothetical protein
MASWMLIKTPKGLFSGLINQIPRPDRTLIMNLASDQNMHEGGNFSHNCVRRQLRAAPRRGRLEPTHLNRARRWA